MTILIFILVLVVLIVVHEFGHFAVAKLSGMRVDEFGLGYPPRALLLKKIGETEYTLNWLPFGGFVKIYGEDGIDSNSAISQRAFSMRPKLAQALTLVAGIVMNLLLAWVLISATLVMGTPRALEANEVSGARNVALTVANVLPGSPAARAGVQPGDNITSARVMSNSFFGTDPDIFTRFVASDTSDAPLTLQLERSGHSLTLTTVPVKGIIKTDPNRPGLGVALAVTGVIPVPLIRAPWEGLVLTAEVTKETFLGLVHLFAGLATFSADLSQVAGPIGIAGAVGNASAAGLAALLSLTAIISVNLAVINLIPIPALDGGRLLFVIIEALTRRPIRPSIANAVNTVGFGLLILLMVVVTAHDIFKVVVG